MKLTAIALGVLNHTLFILAISLMAFQLYFGMTLDPIFNSPLPILTNIFLSLQFPLLHSWLLTKNGSAFLSRFYKQKQFGQRMATTSYTTVASAQLLLTFLFWEPSGTVVFELNPNSLIFQGLNLLYILSWIF
jgi:hypothetical protein